ncbi:MAG: hypothetical protein CMO80_00765 [Verrucomicrobiales bacterium]|nr:hypothetical protein [Verrucomicrobiales bacterium]|tara:strand:+ start:5662 stop:6858 length:1197 start_codon:yes stop_codon:yes gene_type:complete
MSRFAFKVRIFTIEGLNAISLALYFLFLFFFMQQEFGFGNMKNLMLGGYGGFVYMVASYAFGRFGRGIGFLRCLRLAFVTVALALGIGAKVEGLTAHLVVFTVSVLAMGFIWAPIQALSCAGEPAGRVQYMVGIYNTIWASLVAVGYFGGGALFEAWTRGIFVVPAIIAIVQLIVLQGVSEVPDAPVVEETGNEAPVGEENEGSVPENIGRAFRTMSWIANPFAFVAANVCTPTIPTLAEKFLLTPTMAGVFCSVWLFSRAGGFVLFWRWNGWHYHMGWLVTAFVSMVGGFALILMAPSLWMVLIAQLAFGLASGLIYSSSLYYSMHVDTKSQGEHGGVHEAVIGAGNFLGPMIGAAAILAFPAHAHAGAIAVSVALAFGFIWIWRVWLGASPSTVRS